MKRKKIRSKHNDLLNYFIHDERDLSPAYVASCRKFLNSLSGLITKQQANKQFKLQASSSKHATQKPQMMFKTILEFEKDEN